MRSRGTRRCALPSPHQKRRRQGRLVTSEPKHWKVAWVTTERAGANWTPHLLLSMPPLQFAEGTTWSLLLQQK